MSVDWTKHSLSEFIHIKHGFAFKGKYFKNEVTENYLVTPGNFSIGGGFKSEKFKYYDGPIPEDYILQKNDLVVTMTDLSKQADTLGYSALIPNIKDHQLLHNQRIGLVEFKNNELDKIYLYFLLRTREYRHHVVSTATGTTVKHTSPTKILSYEFKKPPLCVQKEIGRQLLSLDNKIVLNTQINQTLEQIAQAIFKSWFVDFEPVKAKMVVLEAGGTAEQAELAAMSVISAKDKNALKQLQTEHPEAYAELAQTAALFPSAMVESELGAIPEGWEPSNLKSCITELRRGISPKYTEENGIRVINQKCIRNHTIDFTLARRNDPSKRKIEGREIEIGDVLVNSTGVGTLGRLAPVRHLDETTVVDSHVTVVRADTIKISKSFISGLMIENESFIEASGAGSTGQTELRKQVLEDIVFTCPSSEIDNKFDLIVSNMNSQIAEFEKQRATLASIRDSLLPKLLSGEISLREMEK